MCVCVRMKLTESQQMSVSCLCVLQVFHQAKCSWCLFIRYVTGVRWLIKFMGHSL